MKTRGQELMKKRMCDSEEKEKEALCYGIIINNV